MVNDLEYRGFFWFVELWSRRVAQQGQLVFKKLRVTAELTGNLKFVSDQSDQDNRNLITALPGNAVIESCSGSQPPNLLCSTGASTTSPLPRDRLFAFNYHHDILFLW